MGTKAGEVLLTLTVIAEAPAIEDIFKTLEKYVSTSYDRVDILRTALSWAETATPDQFNDGTVPHLLAVTQLSST